MKRTAAAADAEHVAGRDDPVYDYDAIDPRADIEALFQGTRSADEIQLLRRAIATQVSVRRSVRRAASAMTAALQADAANDQGAPRKHTTELTIATRASTGVVAGQGVLRVSVDIAGGVSTWMPPRLDTPTPSALPEEPTLGPLLGVTDAIATAVVCVWTPTRNQQAPPSTISPTTPGTDVFVWHAPETMSAAATPTGAATATTAATPPGATAIEMLCPLEPRARAPKLVRVDLHFSSGAASASGGYMKLMLKSDALRDVLANVYNLHAADLASPHEGSTQAEIYTTIVRYLKDNALITEGREVRADDALQCELDGIRNTTFLGVMSVVTKRCVALPPYKVVLEVGSSRDHEIEDVRCRIPLPCAMRGQFDAWAAGEFQQRVAERAAETEEWERMYIDARHARRRLEVYKELVADPRAAVLKMATSQARDLNVLTDTDSARVRTAQVQSNALWRGPVGAEAVRRMVAQARGRAAADLLNIRSKAKYRDGI